MVSLLKRMRYEHLMMVLFALVLTQYTITTTLFDGHSKMQFIFIVIGIICIVATGTLPHNIYSLYTEPDTKPNTPAIGAALSEKNSPLFYCIVTAFAALCSSYAVYLNGSEGHVFFLTSAMVLLYLYAKYLKRIAIVGNIFVSLITTLPIVLVFILKLDNSNASDSFRDFLTRLFVTTPISTSCILAFYMTLIGELIQDMTDINNDHALGVKTLPILIGTSRTKYLVLLLSAFLFVVIQILAKIALSAGMYFVFWYTTLCISVPFSWFLYKLYHSKKTKDFKFLSQLLKCVLFFGILSMLFIKL